MVKGGAGSTLSTTILPRMLWPLALLSLFPMAGLENKSPLMACTGFVWILRYGTEQGRVVGTTVGRNLLIMSEKPGL